MIRVENISKDLGEFFLRDVSIDIGDGEYLMILGPTGAGKTILLETIAGIYPPDKGRVYLNDRDITRLPPRNRNIGMVYQDYMLFPHLTVEHNIRYVLRSRKISKKEAAQKVDELANLLDNLKGPVPGGDELRMSHIEGERQPGDFFHEWFQISCRFGQIFQTDFNSTILSVLHELV